jgi:hypothetical protein
MDTGDNESGARLLTLPKLVVSDCPLERFCALVRAEPSLQEILRAPDDTERFIDLVLTTARNCGFALSAEDVRTAMRGRLPGVQTNLDDGDSETPLPPQGWLPAGTFWRDNQLYVQWSFVGEQRLTEPFFEGNVQRCLFKPFNRLIRYSTPISRLAERVRSHPGLRPQGLIFHISRCGSTLVSQMLAALTSNVVISEASPIDVVVRAKSRLPDLTDDEHASWLAWMISALGQPRCGETGYFIKLDCWHTLELPLFQRTFPDVPWIFLYRDPVEVLVSQLRMPGMQMIPGMLGANLFDIDPVNDTRKPEDYCARVLRQICEAALKYHRTGRSLLVNYRELPQSLWTTILPHFGVESSDRDRDAMLKAARLDAKTPSFEFMPDAETKQREATASVRAVADEHLGKIYRQLEALRSSS